VFNNIALRVNAALAGLGMAYLSEDQVQEHVAEGRLVRVLGDWCPPFSGLSPLLSKPPTSCASVRFAGRSVALPRLKSLTSAYGQPQFAAAHRDAGNGG
jgi:DNA-binding transcriptional LysR family regulator